MRPLRILHVDTERTWRGGEQQALYLALGLIANGQEVAVVGQTGGEFVERSRLAGVTAYELPLRGELNPRAISAIARRLRDDRFDIVHAHTSHAHTQAALAARWSRTGCRTVVSRRVDFGLDRSPWKVNRLKYRLLGDRYIAIGEAVRDVLIAGGVPADRIDVVPSGIDLSRLEDADPRRAGDVLGVEPDQPVIGAVAHFAWHKGLSLLLDAAPAILAARPTARFVLVGDGEEREALIATTRERGLADAFQFPGFRRDVPDFLARFDVVVTPSLMEGLNTTNLDALALARPVVASAVGGIPEAVRDGETGLLFPKGDPAALAAAVVRLLDDRNLAERLGRAGRRLVEERFTKEAMTAGTLAVYRDLVGVASPGS